MSVEQNNWNMQKKIDRLIDDMGKTTFLELLHFVVEVMEDDSQIKILMVRRFLDIFLEFEEIVDYLYDGEIAKKGTFVTNLSVVLFQKELADKTVLIVDDIRLHGRTLDELRLYLLEKCGCKADNIVFKVFADNIDAVKVENNFSIDMKEKVNENRWKKISSSIINSFYISGQPYISHLPYCKISLGEDVETVIEKIVRNDKTSEISTEIEKYYGMRTFLYFMDSDSNGQILKKMPYVEQGMVRIYVYSNLNEIIVVPYSFLKPFSLKGIADYYKLLSDMEFIQKISIPILQADEKLIEKDEYLAKYLYSMSIYVSSLVLGRKVLSEEGIREVVWNREIEEYNFGYYFDVENAVDSFIRQSAYKLENEYVDHAAMDSYLRQIPDINWIFHRMEDLKLEKHSVGKFIESYIKLSGDVDEKKAEQKRMEGIEYLRWCKCFSWKYAKDIWKTIIRAVDLGRGTLTVALNTINQKVFADSLLFAGEQNFSCNEADLVYFIYPLLEYECFCRNNFGSGYISESQIKEGKCKLINLIIDHFPELYHAVNEDELNHLKDRSILEEGMDYYASRYPVYEKDEKLKAVLELTRCGRKG